jgi:hypothetical protein
MTPRLLLATIVSNGHWSWTSSTETEGARAG